MPPARSPGTCAGAGYSPKSRIFSIAGAHGRVIPSFDQRPDPAQDRQRGISREAHMTFGKVLSSTLRTFALLAIATAVHAAQTYVGVFFDVGSINVGGTAAFDMQLRENDGTAFTNGAITVTYPAGLVNDGQYGDPLIFENCTTESPGVVITRTAGTGQLVVTNVSLNAFRFCD